jgi:hypothetical protein
VRASDEVVSNSPLTTVREEPCLVADTQEFLIQVHRVEVVEGYIFHHFFKLEGLIDFIQEGGSGRAGGRDSGGDSYHFFFGFVFITTCGGFFAREITVSFLLEEGQCTRQDFLPRAPLTSRSCS